MGTVFGSFFTLAIYRIPLHKDITHERSFCPSCNHRLEFIDLIPILSYIFLKGKCRYCGQKIRIRYLILEILSGIVFLLAYMSFGIHFPNYEITKLITFLFFVFMYVTVVIVSGIDKEYRTINNGTILFGTIMQVLYILYLYIFEKYNLYNIYRYSIYFVLLLILFIVNRIYCKQNTKKSYALEILLYSIYIAFVTSGELFLVITILTMIFITFNNIIKKIKFNINDKADILNNNQMVKTRIGFFLGISTIIVCLIENVLLYCIN
jgi:prepilin signal peptidase PulO-like enzyme (type II secretory pathway)